jgi:hypothetical protein
MWTGLYVHGMLSRSFVRRSAGNLSPVIWRTPIKKSVKHTKHPIMAMSF